MRPIDGDSVVQQIKEFAECKPSCAEEFYEGQGCKACAWGKIIEIVESAPTINQYGKWIPCSERLPKVEGSYMTTTEYGAVRVNHFYTRNNTWGYKSNRTIAWMPLPEPYREEK